MATHGDLWPREDEHAQQALDRYFDSLDHQPTWTHPTALIGGIACYLVWLAAMLWVGWTVVSKVVL